MYGLRDHARRRTTRQVYSNMGESEKMTLLKRIDRRLHNIDILHNSFSHTRVANLWQKIREVPIEQIPLILGAYIALGSIFLLIMGFVAIGQFVELFSNAETERKS